MQFFIIVVVTLTVICLMALLYVKKGHSVCEVKKDHQTIQKELRAMVCKNINRIIATTGWVITKKEYDNWVEAVIREYKRQYKDWAETVIRERNKQKNIDNKQ